ncbi:MAG: peptidyl-alpha-hydroxyglycine alpha-amidating lyase family protein [Planctomycetota bacterium]|nr:peptidyl-alpha-hydroxyglycine alpha-amidating lyase family protein [Planctomycetota bacterium]
MKSILLAGAVLGLVATIQPPSTAAAEPLDFLADHEFFRLPDSIKLGACSGVAVDSKGNVYLFHRGKQPIIRLDADGKFLSSWGDDVIGSAHGLRIDAEDNVWVTDIGDHQVLKFSPDGKLLLALGKAGSAGDAVDEFNKPTDVAFGADGEIYVTDGYGNNRVLKFTPNGGFLAQWGEAGDGPGQFNLPHTVVIDQSGRIIVGDRENDRVQVFESSGKLVAVWPGFAPFGLAFDGQGHLFVADGRANRVLQLDDEGQVVRSWGKEGTAPGEFQLPHMLAADASGNLYVGEIKGERFQKLIRQ